MKKLNNKGITAIAPILIIVIVILIGAVGFLVYDKQKTANNQSNIDNQQAKEVDQTSVTVEETNLKTTDNIIKFSEIGYQIKVPDELKDLKYVTEKQSDPFGNEVIYLRLSSDSLIAVDSLCTAETSSLGLVGKGIGDIDKLKEDEVNYFQYFGGDAEKQFDGNFVFYSKSRAMCGEDKSLALQQELSNKLKDSFNSIEEIKQN